MTDPQSERVLVVPAAELMTVAMETAEGMCAMSQVSLQMIKQVLRHQRDLGLTESLEYGAALSRLLNLGDDVDEGAQRTDAFQESRNLLLGKRAHADAIPGLEILANDVRCTHAAAIAQIDPEQVFYLRARGLKDAVAKRLVIEGFLQELVERFEEGRVREHVGAALERRLAAVLD